MAESSSINVVQFENERVAIVIDNTGSEVFDLTVSLFRLLDGGKFRLRHLPRCCIHRLQKKISQDQYTLRCEIRRANARIRG